MTIGAPNYIWRKRIGPRWMERQEARLQQFTGGSHAVIEQAGRKRVLLECFCETSERAQKLVAEFGGKLEKVPRNWQAQLLAAQPTKPLRIGKRLLIVSQPQPASAHGTTTPALIIPAGAAFGTGDHATTAMSLRLLEKVTRRLPAGWRMFDAGTGSGVLALAARRFRASGVLAVDNDPLAISTAKENARQNGIRGIEFALADVTSVKLRRFDLITANLYSELLAQMLPRFRRSLRVGGLLICSGLLRQQEGALLRGLRRNGLALFEARRRGKWVALVCSPK